MASFQFFWTTQVDRALRRATLTRRGCAAILSSSGGALDPPGQELIDQFRQLIAVSAFEDGSCRNVRFAQPPAEGSEVLRRERHLGNRVSRIGIEARGNEQQVGLEGDELIKGAAHLGNVLRSRRQRRDRKIVNIRE